MTQTAPAPPEKGACSVLVVSSGQKAAQFLAGLLPPGEFTPILSVTTVGEAKRQLVDREFDLLLINTPLSDDFGIDLAIDAAQNQGCGVLLFVKAELLDAVSLKVENYGILTLARPASRPMTYQAVKLLVATRRRLRALEEKTSSLQGKMEEIRLVNRAKLLLMERLKMSEAEAHRAIEKGAMDACVKRRVIAENIIKTYEN
ncbi:MAG TPA: ANTAR domain-containing protein [Firmicutes bacterium]|nr:ANTAR domain-containing protein [Bacillota bacterium]